MSEFKVGLADAMGQMLRSMGLDCYEVIDWEDRTESTGYCESCWYEYAVVDITYKDRLDEVHKYTYSDSFSALISELADD